MNEYQRFIHKSRYARYLDEVGRRETWEETVDRYCDFMKNSNMFEFKTEGEDHKYLKMWDRSRRAILNMDVMPSMRAMMTAGPALERDNMAGYNCAYIAVDHPRVFDENLYVLLCGTGVGFSVERQYINKLPEIAEEFHESETTVIVSDSKIGWAKSLRELVSLLYQGMIPRVDYSRVRSAGARLKTFGGRASGPEPLERLFSYYISTFKAAQGRRLNSLECHDLMCWNGESVVVGGVRRAAEISLSNLTDERMRYAKSGQWWVDHGQRALANNSVCYTEKPEMGIFLREWTALYESKSGERGIFNRKACLNLLPERRDKEHEFGCNPCSEIVLRSAGVCNLTECVIRPEDTEESIKEKILIATFLGTVQSALTNFRYVRTVWRNNAEEERLLGVSFTGIFDCPTLINATATKLQGWKQLAVEENKRWAELFQINQSAAVTCVKPSGTVSQLTGVASSGLHPSFSKYYIRRVRQDKKDPLNEVIIAANIPHEADPYNNEAIVFMFPMKSPKGSRIKDSVSAIQHLEIWKKFALNWCEHKPSCTIYVGEEEWMEVGAWCYTNFDILSGVSFLPKSEDQHIYESAPFTEITLDEWKAFPKSKDIAWDEVEESEDNTIASQELACFAGVCEI